MATPLPPSQWTRIRVGPAGASHPEEEAQRRRLRRELRERWEKAAAIAPRVRAYEATLKNELLPAMDRDEAAAVAERDAAMGRLMLRIAAEQGYEVLEHQGQPVIFVSAEDQQHDTDLVVAEARLKQVREGRQRLRERLDEAAQHLGFVDGQRPPAEEG